MSKSESINEIATALNNAQHLICGAIKDSTNPQFKSQYADISSVIEAIRKPCAENGLSYTQFPVIGGSSEQLYLETTIMHNSGQWMSNIATIPMIKNTPQAVGSAITYLRRYSLSAIFGVPQADDDAESTMNDRVSSFTPSSKRLLNMAERQKVFSDMREANCDSNTFLVFLKKNKINSSSQIPHSFLPQVNGFFASESKKNV